MLTYRPAVSKLPASTKRKVPRLKAENVVYPHRCQSLHGLALFRVHRRRGFLIHDERSQRLEAALSDQSGYDGTSNHRRNKNCVLMLVDDVVREAEKRGDRSEGQSGRHQQSRIHSLTPVEAERFRQWQNSHNFVAILIARKTTISVADRDEVGKWARIEWQL